MYTSKTNYIKFTMGESLQKEHKEATMNMYDLGMLSMNLHAFATDLMTIYFDKKNKAKRRNPYWEVEETLRFLITSEDVDIYAIACFFKGCIDVHFSSRTERGQTPEDYSRDVVTIESALSCAHDNTFIPISISIRYKHYINSTNKNDESGAN